jgi:hypothetical protein
MPDAVVRVALVPVASRGDDAFDDVCRGMGMAQSTPAAYGVQVLRVPQWWLVNPSGPSSIHRPHYEPARPLTVYELRGERWDEYTLREMCDARLLPASAALCEALGAIARQLVDRVERRVVAREARARNRASSAKRRDAARRSERTAKQHRA